MSEQQPPPEEPSKSEEAKPAEAPAAETPAAEATPEATPPAEAPPAEEVKKEKKKSDRRGKVDLSSAKFGFIGAGKIAEAIGKGLIRFGKVDPERIHVSAKSTKNLESWKQKGCHITKRNYDIFSKYDCDVIFLCFHGNVIKECYKTGGSRPHPFTTNFIPNMKHPLYVLSLVSGVTLAQIRACLLNPENPDKYMIAMHRISVNTASAYGLGLTAIDVDPDSRKCSPTVRDVLSAVSNLEFIPENQMDSACALGGNGLAFVYYYINCLADGAVKIGLNRQMAVKLAAKTAQSAALTLLESGKHPAELRDSCAAPSGPAVYGIQMLDKADVGNGVVAAIEAAHKRAKELCEKTQYPSPQQHS